MIIIALWNIEFHVCFDFVKDIGLEMWNVSQRAPTVSSWSCCQLPPTWASGGKNPVISRIITIFRENYFHWFLSTTFFTLSCVQRIFCSFYALKNRMVFIAKLWKIKNNFWLQSKSTFIYLLSLDKEEMKK